MKVGIVTTWYERGAAYVSWQLRAALVNSGNDVFIFSRHFCPDLETTSRWSAEYVTRASRQRSPMPTDINKKEFITWLTKNNISVVLFNEQHYWRPIIWAKQIGVKTIAYVDYYTEKTVPAFKLYDQIWCNTKRHFSVFKHFEQATYIPWGTETSCFIPVEKPENPIGDSVTFFHSAGMSPYRKGTDLLLIAAAKLARRAVNFKLIIHTQVSLESAMPATKEYINDLQAQGYLTVIEKTISSPGLYHLGDVYVYPSRLEGIGLTIAEAQAVGLPTIVTNEPPMTEFCSEFCKTIDVETRHSRADGYYWPLSIASTDDLAIKMEEFIDCECLENIKKRVRSHAEEKLSWEKNSTQLHALIEGCEQYAIDPASIKTASAIDFAKLPYFENFKWVYYLLYDIHQIFKKIKAQLA
ncbi:MAG: glycosyltransferase [Paracoccaceae bacterium]